MAPQGRRGGRETPRKSCGTQPPLTRCSGSSPQGEPKKVILLQICRAEAVGQQVAEGRDDVIGLTSGHDDGQFGAAELIERLTADTARAGDEGVRLPHLAANDGDGVKLAHTLADGLEQRRALGVDAFLEK